MQKNLRTLASGLILMLLSVSITFGHCDTMEGPVIKDAQKAIELNNVNYVLKWVPDKDENIIKEVYSLSMKVRSLNKDAKELADRYFFETLVRIHRNGEGVAYDGVKPAGTPIDDKILAADKSIETGEISELIKILPKSKHKELMKRFDNVMSLKNFDVNNVEAGRKYIEAYVSFFHFAEGEQDIQHHHNH